MCEIICYTKKVKDYKKHKKEWCPLDLVKLWETTLEDYSEQ
jgi:hypothetical protein